MTSLFHRNLISLIKSNKRDEIYSILDTLDINQCEMKQYHLDLLLSYIVSDTISTSDVNDVNQKQRVSRYLDLILSYYSQLESASSSFISISSKGKSSNLGLGLSLSSYPLLIRIMCHLGNYQEALNYLGQMEDKQLEIKNRTIAPFFEVLSMSQEDHLDLLIMLFNKYQNVLTYSQHHQILIEINKHHNSAKISMDYTDNLYKIVVIEKIFEIWKENDQILSLSTLDLIQNLTIQPNPLIPLRIEKCNLEFLDGNGSSPIPRCSCCHQHLTQHNLTSQERTLLISQLIQGNKECSKLKNLMEWVNEYLIPNQEKTYIIDVGNVGHSQLGVFSIEPVISLINSINEIENTKIILVSHISHKKELELNLKDMKMKMKNTYSKTNLMTYYTPVKENDDVYWILTSLMIENSVVITNDLLRDHHLNKLDETLFNRWRENTLARYYFNFTREGTNVNIKYPQNYTTGFQTHSHGYHLPFSYNEKENIEWYCIL